MSVSRLRPAPPIPTAELAAFARSTQTRADRYLGAHPQREGGVSGVRFSVWAPRADTVELIGDCNGWDGRAHRLAKLGGGVWSRFVPGVAAGSRYKFRLRHADSGVWQIKTDPYARAFEHRPGNASVVVAASRHRWRDASWMQRRAATEPQRAPISIYEVHLGSWQRDEGGGFLGYRDLAQRLAAHVGALGFTHVELLPLTEHPLDDSWGYQPTGYFAPTSRFGTPDDFRAFVDTLHAHNIGVILDWVPAHFPRDDFALAQFDGEPLYEHADPQRGEHPDWDTLVFDFARPEVQSFLISSALHWIEEYHLDGLRVDACASMLYLDYSRAPGEWTPNIHGGKENLEAIAFLQALNDAVHRAHPAVLTIAEESTAWPGVTRPSWLGGLGFDLKWSMGWMHDSLGYLALDPILRARHHDKLSFGALYAHSEHFLLPLSHDEVVHGKSPLLYKLHGDDAARLATLRLLYAYQWTWPGKKLLFMGGEFAQTREWDHRSALDWALRAHPEHAGIETLLRDLNRLYREQPALHQLEGEARGFAWSDCHDWQHSVLSYLRSGSEDFVLVVLNFTPVERLDYRIGVPRDGAYRELLNTDSAYYGGGDRGNAGHASAEAVPAGEHRYSLRLRLPPLSALVLKPQPRPGA